MLLFIWFLPWWAWAIIVSVFLGWVLAPSKETKKICILGQMGTGKTELWCQLQGKKNPNMQGGTIYKEEIESFELGKKEDGTPVMVEKAIDIGGADGNVRYYNEMIKEGTFIYYLIDVTKILENKDKDRQRIQLVMRIIKDNKLENCGLKILGTHSDEYKGTKDDAAYEIRKAIFENKIKGVDKKIDVQIINTTAREDIEIIRKEMLKSVLK